MEDKYVGITNRLYSTELNKCNNLVDVFPTSRIQSTRAICSVGALKSGTTVVRPKITLTISWSKLKEIKKKAYENVALIHGRLYVKKKSLTPPIQRSYLQLEPSTDLSKFQYMLDFR